MKTLVRQVLGVGSVIVLLGAVSVAQSAEMKKEPAAKKGAAMKKEAVEKKEASAPAPASTMSKSSKAMAGYTGDFGVGGQLGTLTGLSTQYFFSKEFSGAGDLGYDFNDKSFGIIADGRWNFRDWINVSQGALNFYTGLGAKFTFSDSDLYLRVPVGGNYFFSSDRFDVFLELVPGYKLSHDHGFNFEFALGGRYYL